MHLQANTVVYGRDPELLETRRLVLESAGYRVRVTTDPSTMMQRLGSEAVDLVVLCHTLSTEDCLDMLAVVHSDHPEASIIVLDSHKNVVLDDKTVHIVSVFEGPKKLLAMARHLLQDHRHAR